MNSLERTLRRLNGEEVDRPPNFDIFMTFAAHHIRQPLRSYYLDYRVLVEANLAVAEDFEVDLLQAISDPYREATGFGLQVEFPEDGLPVSAVPLLAEAGSLDRLRRPSPFEGRMGDRLEAVRSLRERSGEQIPVMGWVEGALAEAGDLRGCSSLLLDLYDRPEWLEELLERCVEVAIDFARAQVGAGAQIIGLGDAIASQVSPALYRRFALPYEQRIFAAVHELGALARLHICGNTTRLLPDMAASGADILDLDWMVDLERAAEVIGDRPTLCGNFDPVAVMLQGRPEEVYRWTAACAQAGGRRSFSAAGCEIPAGAPHANLRAQSRALWDLAGQNQPANRADRPN
jgi:MtaA/CmuA family methyltransferase